MDLRHLDEIEGSNIVEIGMDLSEFYMSVEWDILEVPAVRYKQYFHSTTTTGFGRPINEFYSYLSAKKNAANEFHESIKESRWNTW